MIQGCETGSHKQISDSSGLKKSKRDKPRWDCVKTKYICEFKNMITLKELSETYTSEELTLVRKGNRLSIMPINKDIALELLIKLKKN